MRYAVAYVDGQGNERPQGKTFTSYKSAKAEAKKLNDAQRIKPKRGGVCCYVVIDV